MFPAKIVKQHPYISMLFAGSLMAFNSVLAKVIGEEVPTFFFVGLRYTLIGVCFLVAAHILHDFKVRPKAVRWLVLLAALQTISIFGWFYGLQYTKAINVSLFDLLIPIVVYVGSIFFLHEPRSNRALSGSLVALVGGVMLFGAPRAVESSSELFGNGLILGSAIGTAFVILLTKKLFAYASRNTILGICFFITGMVGLLVSSVFDDLSMLSDISAKVGVLMVVSVLVTGAFSLGLYYAALKHMRAEDSASLFYVNPLIGSIAGVVILGETMSNAALIAAGVIVLGVIISHPIHINRLLFYQKEHISQFVQFIEWMKDEYRSISKLLKKLI